MSLNTRAPWLPPNTSRRSGPSGPSGAKGMSAARQHRRAHRIAGHRRRASAAVPGAAHLGGKPVAMAWRVRRQQPVGPAHARAFCSWITVGHAAQRRRIDRRHRRIAAEADDGRRLDPAHHRRGLAARPRQPRRPRAPCATGDRPLSVADGIWMDRVGRETCRHSARPARRSPDARVKPRAASACASASAGNRCPPVPPAARRTGLARRHQSARRRPAAGTHAVEICSERGRRRVSGQQEAHRERQRDQRGAAIGDERQRHALGRHQVRR